MGIRVTNDSIDVKLPSVADVKSIATHQHDDVTETVASLYSKFANLESSIGGLSTAHFDGPHANQAAIQTPYATNKLYLIGTADPYEIFISTNGTSLIEIADTNVDLSVFYTKTEADAAFVKATASDIDWVAV